MRTLEARNAFVMSTPAAGGDALGHGGRAQRHAQAPDLYGKTGTTNDSMDAWFAGYHPSLVGVVWIGYDTPRKLGDRETGGGLALPVWIDLMPTRSRACRCRSPTAPGVVQQADGLWIYDEFATAAACAAWAWTDRAGRRHHRRAQQHPRPVQALSAGVAAAQPAAETAAAAALRTPRPTGGEELAAVARVDPAPVPPQRK
jgi:membrane carboxypeptidase/penicillin-binding protein